MLGGQPPGTVVGICEDDDALRQILKTAFEREGDVVRVTASGAEAVARFSHEPPHVLVLDIGLPDADGRDVCQALRARGIVTPVIFLSAYDAVPDRLSGFRAGGDDYLIKPFVVAELLLRVQALARRFALPSTVRSPEAEPGRTRRPRPLGQLLDPSTHGVAAEADASALVPLTPTEYRILAALCGAGAVVRREALIAAAWPDGARVADNTLDAYVSRLRTKLKRAGRVESIANVRGVGYTLR